MKSLFIVPYPCGQAPSQRFRFEQYVPYLQNEGVQCMARPFWSLAAWKVLYKKGHQATKAFHLLAGFSRRFLTLLTVWKYDYIFIHREATPIGPPWFEWFSAKVWRKKIIYDFDDAIWIKNTSDANRVVSWFKWHRKTASICAWSRKVSAGNGYLAKYALRFNQQVVVNPTTIDTGYHTPATQKHDRLTIGWTGTHSTAGYLKPMVAVMEALGKKHDFQFVVISNLKPDFECENMYFIQWDKDHEIARLAQFDIGIMPLAHTEWELGKCGFKALQYMAMAIPVVASPVGVNAQIIQEGENGFLCEDDEAWIEKLALLLEDKNLRQRLGQKGRQTVEEHYSVSSNLDNFLSLFA